MIVDWNHFTPLPAAAGGVLIGIAAALLILLLGRIAGISGILGVLLTRTMPGDRGWRIAFIVGLLAAPWVWQAVAPLPAAVIDADTPTLVIAGLLVGVGTRLGAGCTSGHGVCGLSRMSLRSLAATMVFMLAGMATVFVIRHLLS